MITSPYLLERLVCAGSARRIALAGPAAGAAARHAQAARGRVLWRCGRLIITWAQQSERPARRAIHGGKPQ